MRIKRRGEDSFSFFVIKRRSAKMGGRALYFILYKIIMITDEMRAIFLLNIFQENVILI